MDKCNKAVNEWAKDVEGVHGVEGIHGGDGLYVVVRSPRRRRRRSHGLQRPGDKTDKVNSTNNNRPSQAVPGKHGEVTSPFLS